MEQPVYSEIGTDQKSFMSSMKVPINLTMWEYDTFPVNLLILIG
jgi:hypothetical protein